MEDIAYLIKEVPDGIDEDGNEIIVRAPRKVFCKTASISRSEYYEAATDGLKPDIAITISHSIDYEGEKLVRFRGDLYDVIRTYWRGDEVELTLSGKIGIGGESS